MVDEPTTANAVGEPNLTLSGTRSEDEGTAGTTRVSLYGIDPEDALRALLRTRTPQKVDED